MRENSIYYVSNVLPITSIHLVVEVLSLVILVGIEVMWRAWSRKVSDGISLFGNIAETRYSYKMGGNPPREVVITSRTIDSFQVQKKVTPNIQISTPTIELDN